METGAQAVGPVTELVEKYGPRLWDLLEGPLHASATAIAYAVPVAVFAWLFAGNFKGITLLNIGIFALLFGFKWLQSPAMHHMHHSYLPRHRDTNMAVVTSIWDRMSGTLYMPAQDEYTPFRDRHRMLARRPARCP
jgi:sterol desaturase/sphingolipid hydroxylase (fatty acid hydroxylase superfamily)